MLWIAYNVLSSLFEFFFLILGLNDFLVDTLPPPPYLPPLKEGVAEKDCSLKHIAHVFVLLLPTPTPTLLLFVCFLAAQEEKKEKNDHYVT